MATTTADKLSKVEESLSSNPSPLSVLDAIEKLESLDVPDELSEKYQEHMDKAMNMLPTCFRKGCDNSASPKRIRWITTFGDPKPQCDKCHTDDVFRRAFHQD